jgi:hypothetical protein
VTPLFSDRRTFTAEEIKANPEILKKAFEELAATLTAKLVPKDG